MQMLVFYTLGLVSNYAIPFTSYHLEIKWHAGTWVSTVISMQEGSGFEHAGQLGPLHA